MKTIGLIGGMSWESTADYYRYINQLVRSKLGGLHSAKIILASVNFAEIQALQVSGDWEKAGIRLAEVAQSVEKAGADFILICTNTMHKVFDAVQDAVVIPVHHIAEATKRAIKTSNVSSVLLLGTRFTMEETFFSSVLTKAEIECFIPEANDRDIVHRVIFQELVNGIVSEDSRKEFQRIIAQFARKGVGGVILGCTEIGMLIDARHTGLQIFDTTRIHAQLAVEQALAQ